MMPTLDRPIFVVGHPRSGTTLLATTLGRNPQLAMPAETQFFIENRNLEGELLSREDMQRILSSSRIADLDLDTDAVMVAFLQTDRRLISAFACIIDDFRRRAGKGRAGEKSPLHLLYSDSLLEAFTDARIVCIERNGADVIASLMGMPWSHRNFSKHLFDWRTSIEHAAELEVRHPDRFRRVSFAKFTLRPREELQAICHFCDLDFDPSMLEESQADTVPDWERGWKENAAKKIQPTNSSGEQTFTWLQHGMYRTFARDAAAQIGCPLGAPGLVQYLASWAKAWPYHPRIHRYLSRLRSSLGA